MCLNVTERSLRLQLLESAITVLTADQDKMGGLLLLGRHGPVREYALSELAKVFSTSRLPGNADAYALTGGLNINQTLIEGKPVYSAGLLNKKEVDALIIPDAQHLSTQQQSLLSQNLDDSSQTKSTLLIALDESLDDEIGVADFALAERLALHLQLPEVPLAEFNTHVLQNAQSSQRERLAKLSKHSRETAIASVHLSDDVLYELTTLCMQLGVYSMTALLHTCRCSRVLAMINEHHLVTAEDAALAIQLTAAPRAMVQPNSPAHDQSDVSKDEVTAQDQQQTPQNDLPTNPDEQQNHEEHQQALNSTEDSLEERLLAAAAAVLPEHLLANLAKRHRNRNTGGNDRSATTSGVRGRPVGVRRARGTARLERLNIIETLKAAAPKQKLRSQQKVNNPSNSANSKQIKKSLYIRSEDFRITRFKQNTRTTTIFIVDASGSAALNRLAEAKGAVELLLADCYVRRDRVALVTFRGQQANLDLSPTRSLVRAKRALSGLPGGGGTPLASAISMAIKLCAQLEQAGESPVLVFMTDAKPNIALDGSASKALATSDAQQQAKLLANSRARKLFVDTAPRASKRAAELAALMDAQYLPLPRSGAQCIPSVVAEVSR